MNETELKQIYIKVPASMYKDMQDYCLLNRELDIWFIGEMMEKIEKRKNESNRQQPYK